MRRSFLVALVTVVSVAATSRAEEASFDSNGVKINYLDEGKGEVVVLLHGFAGSAAETWTQMPFVKVQILPLIAKEFRVVAPDLRGHGKSGKPVDPKKYGSEMAEDVVRLLDHLKVKKAHVVGYSMGSAVAGKLLVDHPDRLLSLTFGGGGPVYRPSKALTDTIDATAQSLEEGKGVGPLLIALAPEGETKPTAEQAAVLGKLVLGGQDQKVLAAVLRSQPGLEVREDQLKANKVPVAFVYGSRETVLKPQIEEARKALPASAVTVVDKGDHMSTATSPEFRTAVLEFLRKHNPK